MENIRKEKEEFYDNKHYLREIEVISGVSMKNIYSIIETKYNEINEKIENRQPCELYVDEYAKVDYFSPSNKQIVKLYNFTKSAFKMEFQNNQKVVCLKCQRDISELFFKCNGKEEKFEIFCREQFNKIPQNLNINKPYLEIDGHYLLYEFLNLIEKKNKRVYIIKGFEFKIFSKKEFEDFIKKFNINFLGESFKTPKEFEPNF